MIEKENVWYVNKLFILLVIMGLVTSNCAGQVARPPYPTSKFITGIDFHFNTIRSAAKNSDIWPVTWASNNQLYTAWGDGEGFSGTQKVSWGIAVLKGNAKQWVGKDVFYGPPGSGKGKISGLLAIGDTLYAWKNTQNGSYPYCDFTLIKSMDSGKSWYNNGVTFGAKGFKPVSFINFGRGYTNMKKNKYVYIIGFKTDEMRYNVYIARVEKVKLGNISAYEYLSGVDYHNQPTWSCDSSLMSPIFTDKGSKGNKFPVISYDAGLDRYLLTACHGNAGCIGIFEAPTPWGPWKTIYYSNRWHGLTKGVYLGFEFPTKWMSADGKRLAMVFSVYDSNNSQWNDACNVMTVTLTTSTDDSSTTDRTH